MLVYPNYAKKYASTIEKSLFDHAFHEDIFTIAPINIHYLHHLYNTLHLINLNSGYLIG